VHHSGFILGGVALLGGAACPIHYDLVSERKLGIFSKIKEGENYNNRNTLKYFEDLPASGGSSFEPDAEIGKNNSFRSGTI
jgi:hypothetical protein